MGVQLPLTLGRRNEPEPDLAVVKAEAASRDRHPETAELVIEIARESLRLDRKVKGALYARFGVPEYWIVNLEDRVIEVFSDPDGTTAADRRTRTVASGEILASEALLQVSFPVAPLFGEPRTAEPMATDTEPLRDCGSLGARHDGSASG